VGIGGSFPGCKAAGSRADHSSPSSAEVKEFVELYLHFPNVSMARCLVKHSDNFTLLYFTLLYFIISFMVFLCSVIDDPVLPSGSFFFSIPSCKLFFPLLPSTQTDGTRRV